MKVKIVDAKSQSIPAHHQRAHARHISFCVEWDRSLSRALEAMSAPLASEGPMRDISAIAWRGIEIRLLHMKPCLVRTSASSLTGDSRQNLFFLRASAFAAEIFAFVWRCSFRACSDALGACASPPANAFVGLFLD